MALACNASCGGAVIGRGAKSVVVKVQDPETGTTFAVKGPLSPSMSGFHQRNMEADMLHDLHHKNVIETHGCLSGGRMKMEYLDGGSLLDVMAKRGGKLSELEVKHLVSDILEGVVYLHSKAVLHRDIKPANVLYSEETQTAKLADLALDSSIKHCGVRVPVGTPVFLAPEVVQSCKHVQGSDIWAVGCTTLQLLTGRIPWADEDTAFSALFKIGNGQCPPLPSEISNDAKAFLLECFEPLERRPSASELLAHPFFTELPPSGPL